MLGVVGDLVEDVVVRLGGPINIDSDTRAVVRRRQGGSAANVAVAAARAGSRARFIGQVGTDPTGEWLTAALAGDGVDVVVRRAGRTGTVVVLVDADGQRTMLADRAAATELSEPDPSWLDGLRTLHVPFYSLVADPLAATAVTLIGWAHDHGLTVSIDASSAAVIEEYGVARALALLDALEPTVVLCNELEAKVLTSSGLRSLDPLITVIKRGLLPAVVMEDDGAVHEVPAASIANVRDTTGAGDAFAAGFLLALAAGADAVLATVGGHRFAADAIRRASTLEE